MLELKNIVKDYKVSQDNVVHALKGINLKFNKSGLVCILGQSGCGKTTMLNILGGLDKYTSGDLIVDNNSTKNFSDKDWDNYRNKKVGMIFQSYNLIQHMSVSGNVELAMSLSGVDLQAKKAIAKNALIQVGLEKELDKLPNQLSGGQQQRVAIARALVNDPSIILADEPTGALDSKTSIQIMELLEKISESKLIIMVTHNQELAYKYATRIIEMNDGKVIKDFKNKPSVKPSEDIPNISKSIKSEITKAKKVNKNKSSMSILTALGISVKNLLIKKGRTIMTSIAGSFGIIGIALILAVSNGFSSFINNMQEETLASYPLSVDETYLDTNSENTNTELEEYPDTKNVNVVKSSYTYHANNITDDYISYLEKMDKDYVSTIQYNYALQTNVVFKNDNDNTYSYLTTTQKSLLNSLTSTSIWNELPSNSDFIKEKYDVIQGHYPTNSNELILVVNKSNALSESTLKSLGFSIKDSTISFDDILNKTYKLVPNEKFYTEAGSLTIKGRFIKSNEDLEKENLSASEFYSTIINYLSEISKNSEDTSTSSSKYEEIMKKWSDLIDKYFDQPTSKTIKSYSSPVVNNDAATTNKNLKKLYSDTSLKELKIVGILRPKDSNVVNYLSNGVYYSHDLISESLETSSTSSIALDTANHLVIQDAITTLGIDTSSISTSEEVSSSYYFPQVYTLIGSKPTMMVNYETILTSSELYDSLKEAFTNLKDNPIDLLLFMGYIQQGNYSKAVEILSKYSSNVDEDTLKTMFTSTVSNLVSAINTALSQYMTNRKAIGTDKKVSSITIYPKSFKDKAKILTYLDAYNLDKSNNEQIKYTDIAGTVFSAVETMVNIITIVLICFSSISLVVSSVMIGIIMYSSVIERTKEIGILRSIGARKIDISRLFKTEAVIIGFLSGIVGIIFTYIIQFPLNAILENVIEGVKISNLANLNPLHGLILILISMFLTFFSALIPARFAAKKDPVIALRSGE